MTPPSNRVVEMYGQLERIDERTENILAVLERGHAKFEEHDERIRSNQVGIRWLWGVGFGASVVLGIAIKLL